MKESNAMSRYSKSMSETMAEVRANEEKLLEVSPPGFKGTVKAMKKHDEIDNPYALAWHMKNKGDEAHYKNKDGKPEKKEKFKEGTVPEPKPKLSKKDAKTLGKVADLMKKQREDVEVEEGFGKLKDASKNLAKMRKAAGVKVDKQTTTKLPSGGILRKTTYKKEEVEIDEAKKGLRYKGAPAELRARQLVDTSKETLIVKRNRVIVIDKEDEESYLKKGWKLAETFETVDIDILHAEALQENELLNEVEWKVQLKGLPVFYVPAKSAGEVRAMLRKQIKKPDDIISVERVSKGEKKKDFRARVQEK